VATRLDNVVPDLSAFLQNASPEQRAAAAWAAAKWAVQTVGLSNACVSHTLATGQLDNLSAIVVTLDRRYFELQELLEKDQCSASEVEIAFGLARAANAVEFAARGEPFEAVYEALIAAGDSPEFRARVVSCGPPQ
jgi:hypothetical protein